MATGTNKSVGSADPRDLLCNAVNLDRAVNSFESDTWVDRLGVERKTWAGIENKARIDINNAVTAATAAAVEARDDALAVAGSIGPTRFYVTYADAAAAAPFIDGVIVEIARDETELGDRTRYKANATGALDFMVNLSQRPKYFGDLKMFAARMAAGQPVKIAIYGDSTVDGNATTGWVPNPTDGAGNAVGITDHNAIAPNAWPAVLQRILREIYGHAAIEVWNAGYSGKRMDDGWALANYDRAITGNPHYGKSDVTLIAFGLNDISELGSQIKNHANQTRAMINKLLREGTLPVLVTCDAVGRGLADMRSGSEASREIDQVKRSICKEFNIPLIDMSHGTRDWLTYNGDGYRWADVQTDFLHFGDAGHAFKAQFAAVHFFDDVVRIGRDASQPAKIATWDSRSNWGASYTNRFNYSNTFQGANPALTVEPPLNTAIVTGWVWNESPLSSLFYRGIDGEGVGVNGPVVRLKNLFTNSNAEKTPAGAGFSPGTLRKSDMPYEFGRLPYGLSKVQYVTGSEADQVFIGAFEVRQNRRIQARTNALEKIGLFRESFSGEAGVQLVLADESIDCENLYSVWSGQAVEILAEATIPKGAGIVLGHSTGFLAGASEKVPGSRNGWMLFRTQNDNFGVYAVARSGASGAVSFSNLGSAAREWPSDVVRVKVTLTRVGDQQILSVYDAWDSSSPFIQVMRSLTQTPFNFAGACGGLFYNPSVVGNIGAIAQISQLLIRNSA